MKAILLIALTSLTLISFSRKEKPVIRDLKYIEKNLVYIPAGTFNLEDPIHSKIVSVENFYMFNQEVSNGFYLDFVNDLLIQNDLEKHQKALPDTLVWRDKNFFGEKYVEYYFRHPAYQEYPVVGVNHEQCIWFCDWLTQKYNANPKRKFEKIIFTLPDSAQRARAAYGEFTYTRFPWDGHYLEENGKWLANFMFVDQADILKLKNDQKEQLVIFEADDYYGTPTAALVETSDIVAPVISYKPYGYGLYNMSGNVEEFILQKGKTMGGSWRDPGYYLQNHVYENHDLNQQARSERGFRFIMKVIEEKRK